MATHTPTRSSISDNFGLLPQPKGRLSSFGVSLVANVLLGLLFFWIAMSQLTKPPAPVYQTTALIFENPPPPPPRLPPVPRVQVTAPPQPLLQTTPQKIQLPKPLPEPPKPEIAKLNTPPMPAIPPAPPKAVVAPPQPKVGLFSSQKTTAVANNQAAPTVHVGGFGDPSGVKVNPNATRNATVAAVGVFNAAPGASQGAGAARPGVVQGTGFNAGVANGVSGGASRGAVASAGFSNGVVGGTPGGTGNSRGAVATGGFGNTGFGGTGATPAKIAQQAATVPPVVTFTPQPQYTEEARQLKIQGEVTLQVKFGANGKVEVLRVVSGLGHGLDEQAERVAQQIRFKPALRNGQPADNVTYIHILFQLA